MLTRKLFLDSIKTNCPKTKVLYDSNNIVLIRVNSFEDCHFLFDRKDINWCIARSKEHWDEYVGKPFHKQYFLIDFNNSSKFNSTEYNYSYIGFTTIKGKLFAAHARNDENLLSSSDKKYTGYHPFEKILRDKGLYKFVIENNMKSTDSCFDNGMWFPYMLIGLILLAMCTLFFKCS